MADYTVLPFESAPTVPFRFDGKVLYSSGQYELVPLTLRSGESMEPHSQPFDVVFFVVEGSGILRVGEEVTEATENMTIFVGRGIQRAWSNHGNEGLVLLVNKIMH